MMPFKKNRNEAAYFDGKKHFIDVIPDMETAGGGF